MEQKRLSEKDGVQTPPFQDEHIQSACSGVEMCLPTKVETFVNGNFHFQIVKLK